MVKLQGVWAHLFGVWTTKKCTVIISHKAQLSRREHLCLLIDMIKDNKQINKQMLFPNHIN